MVKVNIRRYEAPVTHRVLVELEDGVCETSSNHTSYDEGEEVTSISDHPVDNDATDGFDYENTWVKQ